MNHTINQLVTPVTIANLSKTDICDMIASDVNFQNLLKLYRVSDKTAGDVIHINNEYKNGLSEKCYVITDATRKKLISIIVPIFSSENTTTWDNRYLKDIRSGLPKELASLEDHELKDHILCVLYRFDKVTTSVELMQAVTLNDWLEYGYKGKNGHSIYFVNDKLPNKQAIGLKHVKSDIFVKLLPSYNKKELKEITVKYATAQYKKFANESGRTAATVIKNIADGLYAQIQVYLWMLKEGYNITLEWADGDDLGIDLIYRVNGMDINIDVKSTKTTDLKISKNRKETNFYAVCNWNKTEPVLLGFLFKFNFWKSDIVNTTSPEKKNDMYCKPLTDIAKDLVTVDQLFTVQNNYNLLKIKYGQRLFNAE